MAGLSIMKCEWMRSIRTSHGTLHALLQLAVGFQGFRPYFTEGLWYGRSLGPFITTGGNLPTHRETFTGLLNDYKLTPVVLSHWCFIIHLWLLILQNSSNATRNSFRELLEFPVSPPKKEHPFLLNSIRQWSGKWLRILCSAGLITVILVPRETQKSGKKLPPCFPPKQRNKLYI